MNLFRSISLAAVLCAAGAFGQDATGRILGSVTDPQGAAIAGVRVTITNLSTQLKREAVTDGAGAYQVLQLPIGHYRFTAEASGFRKVTIDDATLEINQSLRIDCKLEVGQVSETVQVEATNGKVETVNATVGQSVTSRPIVNLPLNGRNALNLALLQPGVTPLNARSGAAGTFNVGGGKSDSVTFLLDGGVNNNLLSNGIVFNPNPDTIAEFRILTSNYSAEYGRNAGGIISVVTKSGSNEVHGSAFDFARNEAFNANSFFNNLNGVRRPVLKRHQVGATVGAPVIKDKLFVFGSWQTQRQNDVLVSGTVRTFTPAELQGDFSQTSTSGGVDNGVAAFLQKYPYFQPNPGLAARGVIDPSRIDPVAKAYIGANLIPTAPSGNLFASDPRTANNDEFTVKTDYNLSALDRISVTLGFNKAPTTAGFSYATVPGWLNVTTAKNYFGSAAYTHVFTPTLLFEARMTAQRRNQLSAYPASKRPVATELGITGVRSDDPTGPPNIRMASGLRLGFSTNGPTNFADNTYNYVANLNWTKGRHNLKTGFVFTPYQNNTVYDFFVNGQYRFFGPTGSGSGNDRADFLMGLVDNYTQFPQAPSNIRQKAYGAYVQDEWKLRRNLVMTFGIRYEYASPKVDTLGRSFSIIPGLQSTRFVNAPLGLVFPGDSGAPKGANFADKNDWSPRLGFAWDPFGDGKTSIRGGVGVFYDVLKGEDNLQFNGQAPFFGTTNINFRGLMANPVAQVGRFTDPFKASGRINPFPSQLPAKDVDFDPYLPFGGGGVFFVDPNLRTPYIYQYNFSVQRELFQRTVLELAYVGSSTKKATALVDANPWIRGTETQLLDLQKGAVPGSFDFTDTFTNAGYGNFNSLQASLQRRPSSMRFFGTTYFTLAYTLGRVTDNVGGFREVNAKVPFFDRGRFRAPGDSDIRHRVVFSGGWDLPFERWAPRMPKVLAKGWSLFPIMSWRSGFPIDLNAGYVFDSSPGVTGFGDQGLVRPDLVGASVVMLDPRVRQTINGRAGNYWFDPRSFARPTAQSALHYGSTQRNAFRGPGVGNIDLAVAKRFDLYKERVGAEFRTEFFNLPNNVQWSDQLATQVTQTSGTFGQLVNTANPRIIQLALRLTF